jgi:radical SAM-linked protein
MEPRLQTAAAGEFEPVVRQRVRIRFGKQGDLRFLGHRDLVRLMERLFRRAGLPLGMSEGFHPKPRMSFPSALAVGIEGRDEVMELELAENCTVEELSERLHAHTLPGLEFHALEVLAPGTPKAQLRSGTYQVPIPAERQTELAGRITQLVDAASWPIERPRGRSPLDLRRFVEEVTLADGVLRMRLRIDPQGSAGPRDVLAALGLADLEHQGSYLTRTTVELLS